MTNKIRKLEKLVYLSIIFIFCKTHTMKTEMEMEMEKQAKKPLYDNKTATISQAKRYKRKFQKELRVVTTMVKNLTINSNNLILSDVTKDRPRTPINNSPEMEAKMPINNYIQNTLTPNTFAKNNIAKNNLTPSRKREREREESDSWWPPEPGTAQKEKKAKNY